MASRDIPLQRHPRTGMWQLRRTIPTKLQKHFRQPSGKVRRELSPVSLGTRDEKQAKRLGAEPWAAHIALLESLSLHRTPVAAARAFFQREFQQRELQDDIAAHIGLESRLKKVESELDILDIDAELEPANPLKQKSRARRLQQKRDLMLDRKKRIAATEEIIELLSRPTSEAMELVYDQYITDFLKENPASIDETPRGQAIRRDLVSIIREEAMKSQLALLREIGLPGSKAFAFQPPPSTATNATERTPSLSLTEYYRDVYRTLRPIKLRRGETGTGPMGMKKSMEAARDFADLVGDLGIAAITPSHVREFRALLSRVPRKWRDRSEYVGKPLKTLIAAADSSGSDVPRLAPETVNSTLSGLSAIFTFAVDQEHVQSNPAAGIRAKEATDKDRRPAFNAEELNRLFASPWFTGCKSADDPRTPGSYLIRDHRYWAFLIMLFSGARVAEVGGIRSDQVHIFSDQDAALEFDWTDGDDGRRLKTTHSVRIMPVHKQLVELGFIEFARSIKESGTERLLPGWKPQRRIVDTGIIKNEYSSSDFLKRFKRYLKWLGIDRPGLCIYSFRHTWETATLGTNLNERTLRQLTGRAKGGSIDSYLPLKADFDQLKPVVDSVRFPGLNLRHLNMAAQPAERSCSTRNKMAAAV